MSVRDRQARKNYINNFRSCKPIEGIYFADFMLDVVAKRARRRSGEYHQIYNAIIKHINDFSSLFDCDIFTNSITEDFLEDFISYLEDQGLKHNTIKGYIEKMQSMVRKAIQYNYAVDPTFEEIELREEETFSVFLSMNDISRIYYYKFQKQDKRRAKEKLRDLFVIGCLTGLRYSDYSTLNPDNFQDDYIVKRTKKTNITVRIPAHDYVKEIFCKWGGNIPNGYNIQYFNSYLKVIMKEIGFNDKFTYSYTQGGELKTVTKEKWELISSHTARRSFATNMYLTGRMKTFDIMKITGHKSETCFFRYIKITNDDVARHLFSDIFFKK